VTSAAFRDRHIGTDADAQAIMLARSATTPSMPWSSAPSRHPSTPRPSPSRRSPPRPPRPRRSRSCATSRRRTAPRGR
jgi:hypothetical protein